MGSLNLEETLALITLLVNGGSVCLIKASTVTREPAPVLIASRRASRSLIVSVVKRSRHLGARTFRRGDNSSHSILRVWLDDPDSDEEELRPRRGIGLGDRRRLFHAI